MNKAKKSRFINFCLSLIPGAAQMYMGFMKMGLSMMGLFFTIIAVASMLDISLVVFLAVLVWVYSFFHANNLVSMTDEEFARTPDAFLFGADNILEGKLSVEKYRRYLGIGLIAFGALLLWNVSMNMLIPVLLDFLPHYLHSIFWRVRALIPQLVIGIIVIAWGLKMLRGKQKSRPDEDIVKECEHGK